MIVVAAGGLMVIASLAPKLIALSNALVPLIGVVGVVVIILRLVFFHTRNW